MNSEEKKKSIADVRKSFNKPGPMCSSLPKVSSPAFHPMLFFIAPISSGTLHQFKETAYKHLPYIKSDRFIHQKKTAGTQPYLLMCGNRGIMPCFNSSPRLKPQQRYGIGLLWHPKTGSFLQSQTDTDDAAWGTKPEGGRLYEADTLEASVQIER